MTAGHLVVLGMVEGMEAGHADRGARGVVVEAAASGEVAVEGGGLGVAGEKHMAWLSTCGNSLLRRRLALGRCSRRLVAIQFHRRGWGV